MSGAIITGENKQPNGDELHTRQIMIDKNTINVRIADDDDQPLGCCEWGVWVDDGSACGTWERE